MARAYSNQSNHHLLMSAHRLHCDNAHVCITMGSLQYTTLVADMLLLLLQPLGSSDRTSGLSSGCCSATQSTPAAVVPFRAIAAYAVSILQLYNHSSDAQSMLACHCSVKPSNSFCITLITGRAQCLHNACPSLSNDDMSLDTGLVLMGCQPWNITFGLDCKAHLNSFC